jgi:uncharacterized BrkB/YihY/UPF0761 family membrane protein
VLIAWIYFFAMIAMLGAEAIAISAIRQAQQAGESVGPDTEESVPQHKVVRGGQS